MYWVSLAVAFNSAAWICYDIRGLGLAPPTETVQEGRLLRPW